MPENYFVGSIATDYEAKWPSLFEPAVVDPAVEFLAEAAGAGPILEFGIGTGRLAVPLSRRGLHVCGIELSPDMVAVLRAHEGADAIGVTIGDFAATLVEGIAGFLHPRLPRPQHDHEPDRRKTSRWPASPTRPPISLTGGASSSR